MRGSAMLLHYCMRVFLAALFVLASRGLQRVNALFDPSATRLRLLGHH
jgi:hypothetical protein